MCDDDTVADGQATLPLLDGLRDVTLAHELEELRLDNARLRKLLELSEEEARAAHRDQPTLSLD